MMSDDLVEPVASELRHQGESLVDKAAHAVVSYREGDRAPLAQLVEVLTPLLEADPHGELVRTLRGYLDRESSATDTAAALGMHRNTVMQRLERIRDLLPVDLDDPDDRIVVHLATRALGVAWEEPD